MTTRRTRGTDRATTIVLGLVLLGLAALVWEWRLDLTGLLDADREVAGVGSVVDSTWWPWVAAAVGLVLGLLGLLWLLAHLPRPTRGSTRLSGSDATGRLEADHASLAKALADRWASLAPVTGTHGRMTPDAPDVIILTGHVELEADAADILEGTAQVEREVAEAFPDLDVRVRFLLDGPARQPRTRRSTEITVAEWAPAA
ncbi:hypothetical protein L2K70_05825 [Nocardioides KLBMP 9356]|uniref:Alkaline shock response membrane anchor protein AmaP n=1 Tax=Nocardioides potassii TaxID=2911371 RepID=A0ABS9HA34_9ACTN|nr:hypothetical protein [Nocardioides potassii]MCF6377112.1 hypothetical protein [Nocardioides potassii]